MSVITSKSLNSSILKNYTPNRDRLKDLTANRVRFSLIGNSHITIQEILEALESDQNLKDYEDLLYKLTQPSLEDCDLIRFIQEAKQSIPLFKIDYNTLIEAFFSIRWLKRSQEIVIEFHKFVIDLLAAKPEFVGFVSNKLVSCFLPQDEDSELWHLGNPLEQFNVKLILLHDLLKNLLEVIPLIYNSLSRNFIKLFPYHNKSSFVVAGYMHNLLWTLEYYPEFTNDVLDLIFKKLVDLDANVARRDIEESEYDENDDECMFEMEKMAEVQNSDTMKLPLAETLDICMEKMMEFFKRKFGSDQTNLQCLDLFSRVLKYFESIIMPTHDCNHIQYLIFYICSFKKSYAELFLSKLWHKLTNYDSAPTTRETAVGYLSSFLARANFIHLDTLKIYLKELCQWANNYTENSDPRTHHLLKSHIVFHAVCQAIFYIIAFRSRDLTSYQNLAFLQTLTLSTLVTSTLNPLKVCLPAVATIFAGVTKTYQLAYCHGILERNARLKLATIYSNCTNETPEQILESVFPFDPYLLKKSGKRVQPLYLQYRASELNEEDPSNRSAILQDKARKRMDSMSMDEIDDFIIIKRQKVVKDDFCYSISPGFHS